VSVFIILVGVGVMLYTVGIAFESLLEGRLTDRLGRTRMARQIDHLENHIVVCGWGQVGRSITQEISRSGEDVVVIDREPDTFDATDACAVVGEASDVRVLRAAGLERARGLVVALDSDADNVYVTLSARELNPDLFIVARSNSPGAETKLRQAGADRVVNPHEIGGRRMAAFVMQPHVADFLGLQMRDESLDMRMDEVQVSPRMAGRTVEQCEVLDRTNITVLAVRRGTGNFLVHPPGDTELAEGTCCRLRAGPRSAAADGHRIPDAVDDHLGGFA